MWPVEQMKIPPAFLLFFFALQHLQTADNNALSIRNSITDQSNVPPFDHYPCVRVCVCREGKICMIINTSQPTETETDACAGKRPEHGGGSDRNEWLYPRLRLLLVSAWHGNNRSQRQRRRDAAPNSLHYAKGIYMPSRQTQPATTVATAG